MSVNVSSTQPVATQEWDDAVDTVDGDRWLRSRAWDRFFIVGSAVLVPVPILAFYGLRAAGLSVDICEDLVTLLVMVLVGGPHVFVTYTRTYFEPSFRRRERGLLWVGGLVAAIVVSTAISSAFLDVRVLGQPPIRFLLTFFFFWASVHIVHQNSYCVACYADRADPGRRRDPWDVLDYLLMLGALFPVAFFRMSMMDAADPTGTTADPNALATRIVTDLSGSAAFADDYVFRIGRIVPMLPDFVRGAGFWIGVSGAVAIVAVLFAWKSWRQSRTGTLIAPRFALVTTASVLCLLAPLVPNLDTAFQGLNTWHSFQYLGLVWLLNRRAHRDGAIESRWIRSISRERGHWRYYFAALGATVLLIALILAIATAIAGSSDQFVMFGHAAGNEPTDAQGVPLYRPGSILLAYYVCGFSLLLVHYLHDGVFFFRKRDLVDRR